MAESDTQYAWVQFQTADGAFYPFVVDPQTYVQRDIVDFAPRSGGGDVQYSNLDLYQLVTQDSWHHGLGFVQFRDKFGYRIESDGVDCRHVGMAVMATSYFEESAAAPYDDSVGFERAAEAPNGDILFVGELDAFVLRKADGSYIAPGGAGARSDAIHNGEFYVMCYKDPGANLQLQTSTDGITFIPAGVSGNPPKKFGRLAVHGGFQWGSDSTYAARAIGTAGNNAAPGSGVSISLIGSGTHFLSDVRFFDQVQVGTAIGNVTNIYSDILLDMQVTTGGSWTVGNAISVVNGASGVQTVHFWANADCSDAEGGGMADLSAIQIGAGTFPIKNMASFNNFLHVARTDGVWAVDDTVSPPIARRVLNFDDERSDDNFTVFMPWRGRLYFNVKNTLYAYNGSSLANVTPPTFDLNFPPAQFGRFTIASYRGPYIYMAAIDTGSNAPVLLAFDGTGWFRLAEFNSGNSTFRITGIHYSAPNNALFVGARYAKDPINFPNTLDGGRLFRFDFNRYNELPYPRFASADNHYLFLSEMDFGFRRVVKSFAEVDLEVYDVSAGRYVGVDYSTDTEFAGGITTWHNLGYATTNGVNRMDFSPTVEANRLNLRLVFKTDDISKSPVVRALALKAMIRPNVLYGHSMALIIGDELQMLDGRFNPGSAEQQKSWIRALRNSKAPVTFIDPNNISHQGYISTAQFKNLQRRPGEAFNSEICVVNVVEVR